MRLNANPWPALSIRLAPLVSLLLRIDESRLTSLFNSKSEKKVRGGSTKNWESSAICFYSEKRTEKCVCLTFSGNGVAIISQRFTVSSFESVWRDSKGRIRVDFLHVLFFYGDRFSKIVFHLTNTHKHALRIFGKRELVDDNREPIRARPSKSRVCRRNWNPAKLPDSINSTANSVKTQ